jgi:hypothetical protein
VIVDTSALAAVMMGNNVSSTDATLQAASRIG